MAHGGEPLTLKCYSISLHGQRSLPCSGLERHHLHIVCPDGPTSAHLLLLLRMYQVYCLIFCLPG